MEKNDMPAAPVAVRRGRRPATATPGKELLLKAAMEWFGKKGFEGTSLRALAAEAGVDMALVGRLYGSKAELWAAVIEHLAMRQQEHMVEVHALARVAALEPAATFRKFLRHFAQISYEMPEFPAFLIQEAPNPGERLDTIVRRLVVPFRIACQPIVNAAIDAAIIRPLHPDLFFGMLLSSIALPMISPPLFSTERTLTETLRDQITDEAIRMFSLDE